MNTKPLVAVIAVVAILGAVAFLYLNWPGRSPRIQLDSYQALGGVAAEETARLLKQNGQVVIITPDNRTGANPAEAAQLKAFSSTLKKQRGVSLAAVETFSVTPMEQMALGGSVPRERFVQVLQAHPKVSALVLFAGFPTLEQADFDLLKQVGAKIVVISGYRPGYKVLLQAGLINVAITPRIDSPPENPKPPQTLQEWFDRDYMIVTPDKAPGLPY